MDDRPLTLILRLWQQEDFRAELKPLQGGDTLYFKSAAELLEYLESQPQVSYKKELKA